MPRLHKKFRDDFESTLREGTTANMQIFPHLVTEYFVTADLYDLQGLMI
jgi:hypothetical protein